MHTANNSYIEILKQSLTKKIELLDTIMALNVLQKDMLENPDLDPDELEENLNRKADLVEQLSKLDDGFSQIYDRVRADLTENRGAYSEDIAQMKRDITAINGQEHCNPESGKTQSGIDAAEIYFREETD